MAEQNFIDEKLDLYLSYDYLTAEQYANIIVATNNIFKQIIANDIESDIANFTLPIFFLQIPLVIEEIYTGNSVNTKFTLENRFFPKITIENGDTIHFILPKYTAALIIAGSIITYGADKYEQYLDIRLKQKEIREKDYEYQKQVDSEIKKQSEALKDNQAGFNIIQQNYFLFQSQIQQPNINTVALNGFSIKDNREQGLNLR